MEVGEKSRKAIEKIRRHLFDSYSESEYRILPGTYAEHLVSEWKTGGGKSLGSISWVIDAPPTDRGPIQIRIHHDEKDFFTVFVSNGSRGLVTIDSKFAGIPRAVLRGIQIGVNRTQGRENALV